LIFDFQFFSHIISQVQNFLSENFLLMNENIHKLGQKTNYYQIKARDEVEGFYLIIIGLLTEYGCLSSLAKKFADIKILHEGYTADYFLNRMKTIALFPILFIQNNL
jgi:hypothetical protein